MNDKEFKRSVCFTFFEDYRLTAKEIEKDFGKEAAADYYNAIIDYALYDVEPELKGALKYVWPTTKQTIDRSINRRASGFSRENTDQTEKIMRYKEEHPDATQREIAEATNTSLGKVNKVLKDSSSSVSSSSSSSSSNSNSTSEREREQKDCSLKILFDDDTQEDIDMGLSTLKDWEEKCTDVFAEEIEELHGDVSFAINNNTIYCLCSDGLIYSEHALS